MEIYMVIRKPKARYRASMHSIVCFIQTDNKRMAVLQAKQVSEAMDETKDDARSGLTHGLAQAVEISFGKTYYL